MMAARRATPSLIKRLPAVRGRYVENAPLAKLTWFRVGGPAEVLFTPADADDLADFLKAKPADVPVTIIGIGSNLLVRDGGVAGVVVRFDPGKAKIAVDGLDIRADAGAASLHVAVAARDAGIKGMEFLCGIPGSIGGALRMNGGAYGAETKDITVSARALDAEGRFHDLDRTAMGFTYRHCDVAEDWIFVSAQLRGEAGHKAAIARRMSEIQAEREESQPLRTPTGGSTFKNPEGARAWELIDRAGCRGLKRGGAQVSEKHCNFLIKTGGATAADLESLGEEVRRRVKEATGVTLDWEIRRIGFAADPAAREIKA
jgi:UDP-N-acetylmuramate dehydrogenase